MGLLRKQRLKNLETGREQNCDILYFKKKDDQIKWEMSNIYKEHFPQQNGVVNVMCSFLKDCTGIKMEICKRIDTQKLMIEKGIKPLLEREYSSWNYESFTVADSKALADDYHYDWQNAIQSYAIIFYHKNQEV